QVLEQLIDGADFSEDKVEATLQLPLNKKNGAQQIAAFLVLLRAKGETYEEIVGLAKAMMRNCVRVEGLHDAVDIVGTGSDGIGTVNISTGSTILAAGLENFHSSAFAASEVFLSHFHIYFNT
uniref:Glycosyl transferase family 3 N-terminal domain-containing protein n=1 Tax=Triticum urartu TaxID=4572 RepID=A0A8R7QB47_TRIUA